MRIASIFGLLILLSSAAYDRYPTPVNAAAPTRESRDFSAYVHLHHTRNDSSLSSCH